ncbi:hypothetical protein GYMLUDRAFT_248684 [Collybiopsis luxurians FD-317 M1]|uniref:F-box domain-containing protein n=1 Tax=Collybiopsis luxurians FD-317 M1 TaxID=944289 RepID=A0A0D0BL17_9AGAR|nr:hypothetical protein GYMLUDRAFT_248684 [Collybiopsis luxurians FD-317 M1]
MSLPTELEEAIISHLADSKPDLRVCSLVCKSWLPKSRALLFHSLSTRPPTMLSSQSGHHHRLSTWLDPIRNVQSSPHLRFLLQRLTADCGHVPELTRLTFNTVRLQHLSRLWLCRNDFSQFDLNLSLTRTLESSLSTLIIDRTVFKNACQLLHFLSSPCFSKLHSLSLTDISYLLRSEKHSVNDAEVILDNWKSTTSLPLPLSSRSKIVLEQLEIGLIPEHNIFNVLYHSDSPFDWSRLRKIVFFRIWDNTLIQGFLNGHFPALKSIAFEKSAKMYHFASSGAFTGIIDNSSILSNLTDLSLGFDFSNDDIESLKDITREVDGSETISRLNKVDLILPVDLKLQGDPHSMIPTADGWKLLPELIGKAVAVLSQLASLPSVERVQLIVPFSTALSEQLRCGVKNRCNSLFLSPGSPKILMEYREVDIVREPFSG